MPSSLALTIWFILLVLLFRFDPAKNGKESWALWVPVIWIFFVASRLPSQWLGMQISSAVSAAEEGNSLDRIVWLALILLAVGILLSRSFRWSEFVAHNVGLVAYLSFALLSILWSDFAFVALKRWFRDLGGYFVVLVVLSDSRPWEAIRVVLRRVCYLLIPLSIILIKYLPTIGRQYEEWTGQALYVGPTTGKNLLGILCMFSIVFFFSDTVTRWPDRREPRVRQILLVNFAFIAMTTWALYKAHSATASVCAAIGCLVIATADSSVGRRNASVLKALIPASFCLYLILGFGLGMNGTFAEMVGKDATFTDRTKIWSVLYSMHTDPFFGTGYESFWLGSRLDVVSEKVGLYINEAHNGYLEVYLNLGGIGLFLLIIFLITAYQTICSKRPERNTAFGQLNLAIWTVVLFYNVTEAGFKHGLIWLALLLGAITIPEFQECQVSAVHSISDNDAVEEVLLSRTVGKNVTLLKL